MKKSHLQELKRAITKRIPDASFDVEPGKPHSWLVVRAGEWAYRAFIANSSGPSSGGHIKGDAARVAKAYRAATGAQA